MCRCKIHTVEPYIEPLTAEEKKHPVFSAIKGLESSPLALKRLCIGIFDNNVAEMERRENEIWMQTAQRTLAKAN